MWYPQALYSRFLLKQPHILFGENALMGLKTLPSLRLAVVHGSGITEELKSVVRESTSAYCVKFIRKSWNNEPTISELQENIKQLEEFKPDTFLAIGGGSIIDGAKILRCLYEFPYFQMNYTNLNMLDWNTKFVAIPTTIGSGAELSSACVLYNNETKTKEFLISHNFIPEIVIFDERFLKSVPKKIMFLSCIDAISHIAEGYVSNIENELANIYAEKALKLIYDNYVGILNFETKKILHLQLASFWGGMVQNHCIVGACHAIVHQLASIGYSHSLGISLILPSVIIANSKDVKVKCKYDQLVSNASIGDSSEDLLMLIEDIKSKIDLRKENEKFESDKIEIMSSNLFFKNALNDKGGIGNPIKMDMEFLQNIIKSV